MEAISRSLDELLDGLGTGVTLVTATQRLTRYLRRLYDERQRRAGHTVWQSPDILPWPAWLQRCRETCLLGLDAPEHVPQTLLNGHQQQLLWEQAVESANEGASLLQISATARAAREAWQMSRAWRLALPEPGDLLGDDVLAFLSWADYYRLRCEQAAWLDDAGLADAVATGLRDGLVPVPSRLLMCGFDELTPQQQSVVEALESSACTVYRVAYLQRQSHAVRVSLTTSDDEIRAAAMWVRSLMAAGEAGSIAIVVPNLNDVRDRLERIFDDTLVPPGVSGMLSDRPYNISQGRPLVTAPMVHSALEILHLAGAPLDLERAGSLLRSPFLAGGESEASRRAFLDGRLRALGEPVVSVAGLRAHARGGAAGDGPHACPVLARRLGWMLKEQKLALGRRAPSRWAEAFARILSILGWPGDRTLDSAEYQVSRAWRELLSALSSLDLVTGAVSYADALDHLRRMAGNTAFQPRSPTVPVQVLGLLEAAGMEFDQLWLMGLHDEVWPSLARPNPFLPLDMQQALGLPHSSAERELRFSRGVTRRLLASAAKVVVSSPEREGERVLRPSPLVATIPVAAEGAPGQKGFTAFAHTLLATGRLEAWRPDSAPPMIPGERVSGGAAIFRDQAACPFRAFATHRLGTRELEPLRPGLDPRMRGVLVHEALASVWENLQTHERLCRLSSADLAALVRDCVREAVERLTVGRPETFTERFKNLEIRRLERLVCDWLEQEKPRAPFSVELREAACKASVGGVTVQMRMDRLDEIAGGDCVLIDYKTGRCSAAQWSGERPDEPQLPLYAVSSGRSVEAVVFAQLRPGGTRFVGISRRPGVIPGVPAIAQTSNPEFGCWEELEAAWRRVLVRLGQAFRDGQAAVDPKRYPNTCRNCGLTVLCRVRELFGSPGLAVEEDVGAT